MSSSNRAWSLPRSIWLLLLLVPITALVRWHLAPQESWHEQAVLPGNKDRALPLTVSPDGERLVTATEEGAIKFWRLSDRSLLCEQQRTRSGFCCLAFSPDSSLLASAGLDGRIRLWDGRSGAELALFPAQPTPIRALRFSPDGRTLVSGGPQKGVALWDVEKRKLRATVPCPCSVASLAFSPDGRMLAAGTALADKPKTWGIVLLFDTDTWKVERILAEPLGKVTNLAFSPDGQCLASSAFGRVSRLWNTGDGCLVRSIEAWPHGHFEAIRTLTFTPDGKKLATGGEDRLLCLWNRDRDMDQQALAPAPGPVWSMAFTPDGRTVITSSGAGILKVWDRKTDLLPPVLAGFLTIVIIGLWWWTKRNVPNSLATRNKSREVLSVGVVDAA